MQDSVPVLSLGQIEELSSMVRSIQSDNRRDLDDILSDIVEIEHTSIINLYNLAVEEWQKKQKIIDNLCHFTLTMMSTVQLLWEQKYEHQDKLTNAEVVIDALQRNIGELNDQNETFKQKINQTEMQLTAVTNQRDKIQQLYKSASCIDFQKQSYMMDNCQLQKKCSACSIIQQHLEEQRHELQKMTSKIIEERQAEILSLKGEKRKIEDEFKELQEQHALAQMEVELAEIAVQEALSYKSSYLSLVSNLHEQASNSQLQSKIKDQIPLMEEKQIFCTLNSHHVDNQLSIDSYQQFQKRHLNDHSIEQFSLIKHSANEQKITETESPFARKEGNLYECKQGHDSFIESAINKESVMIMQSSIDMTFSSTSDKDKDTTTSPILYPILSSSTLLELKKRQNSPCKMKKPKLNYNQPHTNIVSSHPNLFSSNHSNEYEQNTIQKLYNMLSMKLVTNRIKKR